MTALEIIHKYEALGVKLWVRSGRLHFKAPSETLNEEHLTELRGIKEDLIAYLESVEDVALTPDPTHRHEPFPVTDVQAAYLVGRTDDYAFGGVGCHGYVELSMPQLDPMRLEKAWHAVIARHDMLRAVVHKDGFQQVLPDVTPPALVVHDLRGLDPMPKQRQREAIRGELAAKQYVPDEWPLCELALSLTDAGSILHCSIDMLIADFVSVDILFSELDHLYHTPERPLPEPEITFRDVVLFQRRQRELPSFAARREQDRQYWLDRLETMPEGPELPVLGGGSGAREISFTRHELSLGRKAWQTFREQAQAHRLTPSCAVLAIFAEVMGRWARQPSFCLAITLLDRPALHPGMDGIIGDFTAVNLLVAHTGGDRPFAARAREIQDRLWQDMEHATFSGIEVLRELGRRRETRAVYPVVFTSMLGLGKESRLDGDFMRDAQLVYSTSQTPQVWLDCQVSERQGELRLNWDVRDGVFPPGMVKDAFSAFETLLGRLAREPEAWEEPSPLELSFRVQALRQAVNDTGAPLPEGLLQDGFLRTVDQAPDSTALICQGQRHSYGDLAGQAEAVRRALVEAGCGPDDIVAVMQPKSALQVASVLGVLCAGAAYLPMDMKEPAARRNAIMQNARVRLALVQGEVSDWPEAVRSLDVASLEPGQAALLRSWPKDPADLAYVIYTSGTTGTPKGVMLEHGAVLNTVADINSRFQVTQRDVLLGVANLNFDLSVYDIFGIFAAGGVLVLPDEDRRSDPGHWAWLVREHGVTLWNSVPAQMHMLLTSLAGEAPLKRALGLRLAMLSGDWIPSALPPALHAAFPDITVMSLGGATEAAIWSIGYEVPRDMEEGVAIPYGTPLANQWLHVLDSRLRPCPDWTVGHLYIGGAGLARGYLNDAQRTRERFIVHPQSGERLYHTGDLGRYRPDGVIEFLGRDDTQVKIRGHRIELGEVESVLGSHPAVRAAVALITGETPQRYKLAAFVEPCRQVEDTLPEEVEILGYVCAAAGDAAIARVDRKLLGRWMELSNRTALLGMVGTLRGLGFFADKAARHSLEDIMTAGRVHPRMRRLLSRWLAVLCDQRLLVLEADSGLYKLAATPPEARELPLCWDELQRVENELHYGQKLLDYLRLSSDHLPALLQGRTDPLDLLFPRGSLDTALSAYNDNLVSRCLNNIIREALLTLANARKETPDRPLRVLEIGAGVGGTTRALIEDLDGKPVTYRFTDVSTFFLNEARERFVRYPWVDYGLFDINKPYWEQGVAAGAFDVIVCANVLHNSNHAPTVLAALKELAAPGGILMVIEAIGNQYSLLTSMEFKEGLTGFADVRAETGQTFFTREQWLEMFSAVGADLLCQYPGPEDRLAAMGQVAFVTRFPRRHRAVSAGELASFAGERLPRYMVPAHIEVLPAMPLSANGKVDRMALARRAGARKEEAAPRLGQAPHEGLEQRVAAIWTAALNRGDIGRKEDFFAAGGDSLLIAQVVAKMRETLAEARQWEWERLMRAVLQEPTVAAVAQKLVAGACVAASDDAEGKAGPVSPLVILAPGSDKDSPLTVFFHTGNGNLAPYRHLLPHFIDGPARERTIAGLSVADIDAFLAIPQDRIIEELGRRYAQSLMASGAGRFELVGYCSGGLIALETARVLLESGKDLAPLVIVSSGPFRYQVRDEMLMERAFGRLFGADVVKAGHYPDEARLGEAINRNLDARGDVIEAGFLESLDGEYAAMGQCYGALARKNQEQRLAAIAAALPNADAASSGYQLGVTRLLYEVFKHTFGAVARYEPMPLAHDIRLFHAKDTSLHAIPGVSSDIRAFWREVAIGGLEIIEVEGNHMSCMQPPHVAGVAKALLGGEGQA